MTALYMNFRFTAITEALRVRGDAEGMGRWWALFWQHYQILRRWQAVQWIRTGLWK